MSFSSPPQSIPRFGRLVGSTLLGATLVAAGLLLASRTIATPLVASLVPSQSGSGVSIGLGVWSFALIAGGGLLVAGANRLATIVAPRRRGRRGGGWGVWALRSSMRCPHRSRSGVAARDGRRERAKAGSRWTIRSMRPCA